MDQNEYEAIIDELKRQVALERARAQSAEQLLDDLKNSRAWRAVQMLKRGYALYSKVFGGALAVAREPIPVPSVHMEEHVRPISAYDPLTVPCSENPTVTILIAAHDHFDRTYNCIESIIRNTGDIPYEILLVDDRSEDATCETESLITGIKCIHNKENLQFLRSCNTASQYARGKYLLLLNNDTEVMCGWLEPLVELMENDPAIGLAGSKLLFPNGRLQVAGGMIWQDGSAANYGCGDDPRLCQYNYVKDVDYLTGASVIIRRDLWEKLGGFDKRFAPAYCEDVDLAFAVRAAGYRTVYQPMSEVVHFEGTSNGTDVYNGAKQYQVRNKYLFREKWQEVLQKEHELPRTNVFRVRERTAGKKVVLIIDWGAPEYDTNAGDRTMYQYIRVLSDMGYCVKFLGNNYRRDGRYIRELQQMGVEVLYDARCERFWKAWIKTNGGELDYVLINRAAIMQQYSGDIKKYTDAKLLFNLCDLEYVRELTRYQATGDASAKRSYLARKKTETEMIRRADVVLSVSTKEKQIIADEIGYTNVVVAPIFAFENRCTSADIPFSERKDLFFVGGFRHNPNVDGIVWFATEVLPLIVRELPDIKLNIVGSHPSREVLALGRPGVNILGKVDDAELERLYSTCRICVIPLRYGGGVKGKTVEAMYQRIGIVSTDFGVEGLPDIESCLRPYVDAESFAKAVTELYTDEKEYTRQTDRCYAYAMEHFSASATEKMFRSLLA